jgi:rfaE bifunctional protein nucleotidyltransferase chain/domain
MTSLAAALPPIAKLHSLRDAANARDAFLSHGHKAVLTNGCFDLLHAGHIYFLKEARRAGDALFVALNSDASVRALKGPSRPFQSERERAYALSALACVDVVFIFNEPRLSEEIRALRPDIYVKAGDYSLETLDAGERAALHEAGAEIRFLPFLPGFSTTGLIKRIAAAAASSPSS